jgi:beta-galactosidase
MLSACDRIAFHYVLLTAAFFLSPLSSVFAQNRVSSSPSGTTIYIDASTPAPAIRRVDAHLGAGQRPAGETLSANSQYLVLNGKPWLPVMGEFHYSRVPQQNWETEILKMKAGGVEVISTYVIWIHHEEVESQFDWTGRRNLRAFVLLCAKHRMFVYLRIGPWVHGETRNGGIPDWAMQRSPVRRDDPTYLAEVSRYFGEVGQQLASQLWSEGGPVIGIQLENEYMRG